MPASVASDQTVLRLPGDEGTPERVDFIMCVSDEEEIQHLLESAAVPTRA